MTAVAEPAVAAPPEPFRGLQPYRCQDRPIFFERSGDGRRLLQAVTIYRGVLFYGESGLGKSSLVNARLVPDALDAGLRPERVLVRPEAGKEIVVEAFACGDLAAGADGEPWRSIFVPAGADSVVLSLEEFEGRLHALTEDEWPLLIFDQFEEIVTLFAEAELHQRSAAPEIQRRIVDLAIRLLSDETLPVKQLFVFREDYLAKIHQLFAAYPELRGQSVRLERLPLEAAHRIIRGPFEAFPGAFEPEISPALANRIVASLEQFARQRRQENQFNLSDLQIVCQRLWASKEPDALFARQGAEGLVKDYLEETLDRFPVDLREPAIALLTRMVTASGTRNVISRNDLLSSGEDTEGIDADRLESALGELEKERRLVQSETRDNGVYYQIVSEFLIGWIAEQKEARRLEAARRRSIRHLLYAAGAVAALTVLLVLALWQWRGAERAREDAETALEAADSAKETAVTAREEAEHANWLRKVIVQGQRAIPDRLDLALLLGVAATDERRGEITEEARSNLLAALTASPRLQRILPVDESRPSAPAVAVSPDGTTAAFAECRESDSLGCSSTVVRLQDLATDEQVPGIDPATDLTQIMAIAFSADGRRLAAAGLDGLTVWNLAEGSHLTIPPATDLQGCNPSGWTSIAVDADAATAVVGAGGGGGGCLVVWDVAGRRSQPLTGDHEGTVTSVAISDDGRQIVSGDATGRVLLWDMAAEPPQPLPVAEHDKEVRGVAFGGGGSSIVSVDRGGTVLLWDVAKQEPKPIAQAQPDMPSGNCCAAFSAGGGLLAAGGSDGSIKLWRAESGEHLDRLLGHAAPIKSLSVSGDGSALVSAGEDGQVIVWDAAQRHGFNRRIATLPDETTSIAVEAGGNLLAVGTRAGTRLFTLVGGPSERPRIGAVEQVYSVAFGASGPAPLLATGGTGLAELWNPATGELLGVLPTTGQGQILSVAFNPDGTKIAVGTSDGEVAIWDVQAALDAAETGATAPPVHLPQRRFQITAVAFSEDGAVLAAAGADGAVVLWAVAEGRALESGLPVGRGVVKSLAFGHTSRLLAAGKVDGTITLFDLDRPDDVTVLTAHADIVVSLAFNADDTLFASAGRDGRVLLWDVAHWSPLELVLADQAVVGWSLAFGAGATAHLLAAAGSDGAVVDWEVDIDSWRTRACRIAGRPFTAAEAAEYDIEADADVCRGNPPARQATPVAVQAGTIVSDVHRTGS